MYRQINYQVPLQTQQASGQNFSPPNQAFMGSAPIQNKPVYQQTLQPVNMQQEIIQYPKSPYKYPDELVCIERDEMNLYVSVALNPPSEKELMEGTYPGLDVFGKSRFDMYIFKFDAKASVKFSLSFKTAKLLCEKTKATLYDKKVEKDITGLTPAYSVKLKGGNELNGRTPAEVLFNSPELRDSLISQMNYYMKNASNPRFGKNNLLMAQAIDEAFRLQANNMLDSQKIGESPTVIYEAMRTPNKDKVDARGLTKARTIKITHTPGSPMPYAIDIMNCLAPPLKGKVGAELQRAVDVQKYTISATEEEWFDITSEMQCFMDQYRDLCIKKRFTVLSTAMAARNNN